MTTTFYRYLTHGEERQLMGAIARIDCPYARRDYHLFRLMLATGIRVGSACGLTVGDARAAMAAGYLTIRPEIAKRGQRHEVALHRRARQALVDLLRLRRELGEPDDPDAPLLVGRKGAGLSARSVQARIKQWAREAGLDCADAITPHWLRHTLAKRLMEQSTATDPLAIVRSALGHRSVASTVIYTAPDKETVADELRAMR